MDIVSITSQGQISIPAKLRRKLGLGKIKRALVSEQDGKVVIEPLGDILELRGTFETNKRASSKRIRLEFEKYLSKRSR